MYVYIYVEYTTDNLCNVIGQHQVTISHSAMLSCNRDPLGMCGTNQALGSAVAMVYLKKPRHCVAGLYGVQEPTTRLDF